MKIIKSDGGSCLLKMTQEEWSSVGKGQGWFETNPPKAKGTEAAPTEDISKPDNLLSIDQMTATRVEKYGDKFWAVYVESETGDQLLCVTCYRKGAGCVQIISHIG